MLLMTAGLLVIALAAAAPVRAQELEPDLVVESEATESTSPAQLIADSSEGPVEEPAANPDTAGDSWAQITERQKEMKSERLVGSYTMKVTAGPAGEPMIATGTYQGESSGEDFDLRMNIQVGASGTDMRMILLGDTAYMNVQDTWTSIPRAQVTWTPPRAELPTADGNGVMLALEGQDQVKGVPCDVYSFVLGPEALAQGMALAASLNPQAAGNVRLEKASGEVCVGMADGFYRRLNMKFRMAANSANGVQGEVMLDMDVAFEFSDINSPDIVIRPPAAATAG